MGKTMMGGSTHEKNISMLTPEQQQLYSSTLTGLGPQFQQGFGNFMQPQSQEDMDALFQKSYVDPAMQTFEQRTIPGIQQAFSDANAGSSSALNQALAQGASDLSTSMGSQYGNFQQNQQQMQLQALMQFLPLLTNQTFSPLIQQKQGLAGPLIGAAGQIGQGAMTAAAASSRDVKENIKDYEKGLNEISKMNVKQYDYIKELGGEKDRVGLIAEDMPKELTAVKDGILHADLYGLLGLLINSVKQLNVKMEQLEAR